MVILLLFAFISGLLTILAPCIWPLLPIVLSASSTGGKRKPLGITLGIMISFGFFTLTIAYLVRLLHLDPNVLRTFSILVLLALGLTLLVPRIGTLVEGWISRLGGIFGGRSLEGGLISGLITGLSLGVVWTPCAGPIFATIASLAATQAVSTNLIVVTVVYIIGIGIPLFVFTTAGGSFISKSRALSPYLGKIQQFFGVVVMIVAIGIWTNYDKIVEAKLLTIFPSYSNFLLKLEGNEQVQKELAKLRGVEEKMNMGIAPEIIGIENWINSQPLSLLELKGKVILVDFWTYTCINCIRTLPYVTGWYEKYKDQGLMVIGIHTPEFEFEKDTQNVINATKMFKINYPVAQDNDYKTWNNFGNNYWPAKYLIDAKGYLRLTHFGEGNYEETEKAIQSLLAEAGKQTNEETIKIADQAPRRALTPETYLGTKRRGVLDYLTFEGKWTDEPEFSQSNSGSSLTIDFNANKVFLVITPTGTDEIKVWLDGKPIENNAAGKDVIDAKVKLDEPRLYELIDLRGKNGKHLLKLEFGTNGTKLFAFTFG